MESNFFSFYLLFNWKLHLFTIQMLPLSQSSLRKPSIPSPPHAIESHFKALIIAVR